MPEQFSTYEQWPNSFPQSVFHIGEQKRTVFHSTNVRYRSPKIREKKKIFEICA